MFSRSVSDLAAVWIVWMFSRSAADLAAVWIVWMFSRFCFVFLNWNFPMGSLLGRVAPRNARCYGHA